MNKILEVMTTATPEELEEANEIYIYIKTGITNLLDANPRIDHGQVASGLMSYSVGMLLDLGFSPEKIGELVGKLAEQMRDFAKSHGGKT